MNSDLHSLKEIFHAARERPPGDRKAFLDEACGANEQLRREVEQLLESDRQSDRFIADPPAQLAAELFGEAPDGFESGRVVGQYRLIECIGTGGMGAVYLGERADRQFEMQVAVKLIKRGMDTDAVLRRFQHERQILASLAHPNIARLLDGGTTEEGVPYFVMEYIQGERIDRYAETRQLSVTARLELFRQVCGAVSFAHQRLIVHRDLKPSNILVTPDGTPKLLDFGIAKIIQPNDEPEALATLTLMNAMTPEYASPEQIEGAPATTLSDVYSLGAVLYELLSSRPPYQLKNRSPQAVAKAIETAQIQKPSAIVNRSEDARRLRGDLDNIVLMAMRRDSARRYPSVEQFSEDIRRHLAGRPVIARADTLSYRVGKFVQRNEVGVAAAALLLFTLIGGIVATAWQARKARLNERRARSEQARAERRFNEVRKLANSVLFDYHDAIKDLPGATKVRERLVKDALNYLDSLAAEAHGDPALQAELAAAYERVGDVRGGTGSGSLGDVSGAAESYTKALRIREALAAANPADVQAQRQIATSEQKLGWLLLDTSESRSGLEHLRKAVSVRLDLTRAHPDDEGLQFELTSARNWFGNALSLHGDTAGSLEQHRIALAVCEKLVADHPTDVRYRRRLVNTYEFIASALFEQNNPAGAIETNNKAQVIAQALVTENPSNPELRRFLLLAYQHAADYRSKNDKAGALEYYRKAAAIDEEMLATDAANALTRRDLAYADKKMADLEVELGDNSQALVHFGKARQLYEKLTADGPGDLLVRFLLPTCQAGVARIQARLGDVDLALEECRKASALVPETSGNDLPEMRAQTYEALGYAHVALAEALKISPDKARDQRSAARDMFAKALHILEDKRSREGSLGPNEDWFKEIAGEIAKCDAALKE